MLPRYLPVNFKQMRERLAVLDLGTNTFHLLIAEKTDSHHAIVHRDRKPVKLGRGGINHATILPDAAQRAIDTLLSFKEICIQFDVSRIIAFGTSAWRNAGNAQTLAEEIKQKTGIDIRIISGEREAQLIYQGVNMALRLGDEKALIVDIGAGSVEFIIGSGNTLYWKQSFEIGGQRLIEKFKLHDPITPGDIQNLHVYFEESLMPLIEALKQHNPQTLAGSSGTFDTLSDIYCAQRNIIVGEHDDETPFAINSFESIHREIISKNRAGRLQIKGMIELRVDLIVAGSCLVQFLVNKHRFKTMRVSRYSLLEGVLAGL